MTLDVCHDIPEIINIPDIPDIPGILLFLLFLKLLSKSLTMENLEVLASKMSELWPFQIFQKKSPDVENSYKVCTPLSLYFTVLLLDLILPLY